MATTKCRQCAQSVEMDAQTCPHCGVSNPARVPTALWIKIVIFLALVAAPVVFLQFR